VLRVLVVADHVPSEPIATLAADIPGVSVRTESPAEVLRQLPGITADVVLVDGRSPGSLRFVRAFRSTLAGLPILFVAPTTHGVIDAIYAGANDFVLARVSGSELGVRIHLLTNGGVRQLHPARQIGAILVDRDTRTLSSGTRSVSLSPIELKVFERLLLDRGRPVSRSELERSIWGQEEADIHPTNIAVVYVSYLRRKLSRLGDACSITTITHAGYALDVRAAIEKPRSVTRPRTSRPSLGKRER
jgi:DNA-binding response OmpR family regulator